MTMMRRTALLVVAAVAMLGALVAPVSAAPAGPPFPDTIPLPDGLFPEGIAIDDRTAYVGSLIDGSIQQQDLKAGTTTEFAPSPGPDRIAVGMTVDDRGRLWVAGGGPALSPGLAPSYRVYDTATGELILEQEVAGGFINDVIVTAEAAWFTDSFVSALIRVPIAADGTIGAPESVPLVGDWVAAAGFNANGIEATADGGTLIVAQSTSPDGDGAALYQVPADPTASELAAERIVLDGTLPGADGLVLVGRTLHVVAGGAGVVEVRLSLPASTGTIVDTVAVPGAVTPTTAARFGSRLYVVDARFDVFGVPTTEFATIAIPR